MSHTLPLLPHELFTDILRLALDVHPTPHAIPRVNTTWADVSLPLLHSHIRLPSSGRLGLFAAASGVLRCAPGGREVEVRLPGGTEGAGVWALLQRALARCEHGESCCRGVRVLRLCLNSHMSDPNMHLVREALCQINPEEFVWTGPDPDHHFSTAIVSSAASQLCRAVRTWSALRRLELANIAFLYDGHELAEALMHILLGPPSPFPPHTACGPVRVVISQAVFMLPVAALHIALGVPALRELHLVDVYQHSIWGPRMRRGDVEAALATGKYGDERGCLERVREVVRCVARTERLMGGDREVLDE